MQMPSMKKLILIFTLNDFKFAIDIEPLIEVSENVQIASGASLDNCLGMMEFRKNVIPLVDIKEILEIGTSVKKKYTIIVIRVSGFILAVPVDSVKGAEDQKEATIRFPDLILKKRGIIPYIYEWKGEYVYLLNLEIVLDRFICALTVQKQDDVD